MAVRHPPRAQARPSRREGALFALRVACLALLLGLTGGCGGQEQPAGPPPASWPLRFEVPAVLGFVAARSEGLVAQGLRRVGWQVRGLDPTRPELLLLLDPTVLGAPLGLVLPLSDGDALAASLAQSPLVEDLGGGRHRVTLPPEHPLRMGLRLLHAGQGLGSLGDLMSRLDDASALSLTLTLELRGDWALLVPSFEASLVARQVLAALPLQLMQPGDVAAALDIERIEDTFHEELSGLRQQLQGLAGLGVPAGFGALLAAGMREGRGSELKLPVSPAFLWTVAELLDVGQISALGLQLSGAIPGPLDPGSASAQRQPVELSLRVAREQASALTDVASALRPAGDPGTGFWLEADAPAFSAAVVRWLAPLAEFVKGEGPPATRWLDSLGELLAPWSGRVVLRRIDGGVVLVLGTRPGRSFDGAGWSHWLETLRDAAGADPDLDPASLLGADRLTLLPRDQGLLAFDGDVDADDVLAALAEVTDAVLPGQGPVLRLSAPGLRAELWVDGTELRLESSIEADQLRSLR